MSRLTYRDEHGTAKLFQETLRRNPHAFAEKLAHYEDLEEQGRLIELPCRLYEEVWVAHEQIATFKKRFERESTIVDWMEQGYVIGHTKAEVERKLAELKGGEE